MRFSHAALSVSDISRSRAFYETVFGLTLRAESRSDEAHSSFVQLQDESGSFIELFQHDHPESAATHPLDMTRTGIRHISFFVEDVSNILRVALSTGATLVRDVRDGTTVKRNAFIVDPDGIGIELIEV